MFEFGAPDDAVRLVVQADLHAGRDELVVSLEAASINPSDLHLIGGFYGVRPALPAPLGVEGVGRVIEAGLGVEPDMVGRRIVILPGNDRGSWAEEVVVAVRDVLLVSDEADALQLAMAGGNPTVALLLLRAETLTPGD